MTEKGVTVLETEHRETLVVKKWYSDKEILELFPDCEGTIVNALLRRAQRAEAKVELLRERLTGQTKCSNCGTLWDNCDVIADGQCATCWQQQAEEVERLQKENDGLVEDVEKLLGLMQRVAISAMPHHDPLSSEGAKVDYYMIAVQLYNNICQSLHGTEIRIIEEEK